MENGVPTILNRFSLSSESGGEVLLRFNVVKQAKKYRYVKREQKKKKARSEDLHDKTERLDKKHLPGRDLIMTPQMGLLRR